MGCGEVVARRLPAATLSDCLVPQEETSETDRRDLVNALGRGVIPDGRYRLRRNTERGVNKAHFDLLS